MKSIGGGLSSWSGRVHKTYAVGQALGGQALVGTRRRGERVVWALSLANTLLVVSVWLLLSFLSDVWWPVTLMSFGPRWVWALPSLVLLPLAAKYRRAVLWPTLPALLLVLGPVMGLCVPWRSWFEGRSGSGSSTLRLLSCNVHGTLHDPAALATLVATTRPDLVALQEWTGTKEAASLFPGPEWHVSVNGDMCIASRFPIRDVESLSYNELGARGSAVRCVVDRPEGPISFFNVHPKSARNGLRAALLAPLRASTVVTANINVRQLESEMLEQWASEHPGPVLLAGDFNLPADSAIYRRFWSSYSDAFASVGFGYGYTWWSPLHGIRIDHILAGTGWRASRCWVGPDVGSDHRPLIAELEWAAERQSAGGKTDAGLPEGERLSARTAARTGSR